MFHLPGAAAGTAAGAAARVVGRGGHSQHERASAHLLFCTSLHRPALRYACATGWVTTEIRASEPVKFFTAKKNFPSNASYWGMKKTDLLLTIA